MNPECKIPVCDHTDLIGEYCRGHYQRIISGVTGEKLYAPIRKRRTKAEMEQAKSASTPTPIITEDEEEIAPVEATMHPLLDQQVAIEKFREVTAALCGDSMGVGKTVTGIGRDFQLRKDNPQIADGATLIICEKIGIDVWDYHLKAMGVPNSKILLIDPTNRIDFSEALADLQRFQAGKLKSGSPRYRYYVMHWDVLRLVDEINEKTPSGKPRITFAHVIADEVHLAKNRKALKTIELKRIATEYKTGLSGTPADDKPWDIWSILHWLYPRKYASYWRFYNNHVDYVASSELTRYKKWIKDGGDYESYRVKYPTAGAGYRVPIGVKNIPELHQQIQPFYIRRTLLEVAPDMPEKVPVNPPIIVPMERKQRKEYEQMRDKAIALIGADWKGSGGFQLLAPAVIAVLTRLQQMSLATLRPEWDIKDDAYSCDPEDTEWDLPKIVLSKPSPKLDAVMNLITTHEEEPFVVFTQFRGMADLVEEECQRLKIPVVKIHGGILSKDTRTQLVADFQDGRARVFVGTIAAAGKTITLTRANHVIFTDHSWNPSKNAQAEDRLWRRTQRNTVRVYTIQSKDSIDQVREAIINNKANMIDALLNPGKVVKTL